MKREVVKPVRPRRAACVYGKAEGPFHPKGPAGGWCGTGSEELWIFLPRNRIICQVENSLSLDRGSAMNASSTELHRKIRRTAGRAPSEAAECGPAASKMRPKRGGRRGKSWKASKDVWKACNPLQFHKTAKDFFGKAWSETRDFWRSLEKRLEGAFIPPPLASHQRPPIKRDRHCCARRSSAKSGLSIRKSGRPVSSKGTGWRTVRNSQ